MKDPQGPQGKSTARINVRICPTCNIERRARAPGLVVNGRGFNDTGINVFCFCVMANIDIILLSYYKTISTYTYIIVFAL